MWLSAGGLLVLWSHGVLVPGPAVFGSAKSCGPLVFGLVVPSFPSLGHHEFANGA